MAVYNYYEEFLREALQEFPDKYNKIAGDPVHDICSALAIINAEMMDIIQANLAFMDPRNRTGSDLDAFIYDHSGLERKDGVYASVVIQVTGSCTLTPNHYFSTETGIAFHPIALYTIITAGEVECECILPGTSGNVPAGSITKCNQSVPGLISVTNPDPASGGVTAETDEDFLDRYYDYIRKPQGAGTVEAIRMEVEQIEGVGSCTVTADRPNSIATIVITASDGGMPSEELINRVQEYVDPRGASDETWGCGYGIAPIGLRLDVITPTEKTIKLKIYLTDSSVVDESALNGYFVDNLYKSADWRKCFEGGIVDYLSLYNVCQNTVNSFAEYNGIAVSAVNIRDFAFFVDNADRKKDYSIGNAVASGGQLTVRNV